jgi:hypothetical protein
MIRPVSGTPQCQDDLENMRTSVAHHPDQVAVKLAATMGVAHFE